MWSWVPSMSTWSKLIILGKFLKNFFKLLTNFAGRFLEVEGGCATVSRRLKRKINFDHKIDQNWTPKLKLNFGWWLFINIVLFKRTHSPNCFCSPWGERAPPLGVHTFVIQCCKVLPNPKRCPFELKTVFETKKALWWTHSKLGALSRCRALLYAVATAPPKISCFKKKFCCEFRCSLNNKHQTVRTEQQRFVRKEFSFK